MSHSQTRTVFILTLLLLCFLHRLFYVLKIQNWMHIVIVDDDDGGGNILSHVRLKRKKMLIQRLSIET